jgi:hypothetical protein
MNEIKLSETKHLNILEQVVHVWLFSNEKAFFPYGSLQASAFIEILMNLTK